MENSKRFERSSVKVFVLFLCFAFVFSGCSIGGGNIKQSGFFSTAKVSSEGGVDLTFADGSPATSLIAGQPTTFAFVFTNYQKHEITDMKLKVKNFEQDYVSGLNTQYSIGTIPKATDTTGAGVYAGHIVEGVRVNNFVDTYNFDPKFDYCYTAKSSFREQVCIPNSKNECDAEFEPSAEANGPVEIAIERISSIDNQVRIDFVATNTGNGKVVNECFNTEDYANKYDLTATLGTKTGSCEAVSGKQIINGKSNFYCTFAKNNDDSYASQIVVELKYLYQQETELNIVVKDLNSAYN